MVKGFKIKKDEVHSLVEAIGEKFGYDFSQYTDSGFKRRLQFFANKYSLKSISEFEEKFLNDKGRFNLLLEHLTVTVTELFREPEVFLALRNQVIPHLKTYSRIKIWSAGCSTGEEIFSLAILMNEEGLLKRCTFYGTDINPRVLEQAKSGIISLEELKTSEKKFRKLGFNNSLAQYFTVRGESAFLNETLLKQMLFSSHNLMTDQVFGEMHLILCRNILIYFKKELQNRSLKIIYDSLCRGGFLCLGTGEDLMFSNYAENFETLSVKERIFRRLNSIQLRSASARF